MDLIREESKSDPRTQSANKRLKDLRHKRSQVNQQAQRSNQTQQRIKKRQDSLHHSDQITQQKKQISRAQPKRFQKPINSR